MSTNVQAGAGSGTREWDAGTYDRVSTPQQEWARPVVARLGLRGDETVLDAGCGSGRVTEVLLDALPRGEVIAVDGSAAMVAEARAQLGEERVSYIHSDLLDLDLDEAADAVFSNAVFHWITDHERLFKRLRSALRPGGRIEAQCGGEGNVAAHPGGLTVESVSRWSPPRAPWPQGVPPRWPPRLRTLRAGRGPGSHPAEALPLRGLHPGPGVRGGGGGARGAGGPPPARQARARDLAAPVRRTRLLMRSRSSSASSQLTGCAPDMTIRRLNVA